MALFNLPDRTAKFVGLFGYRCGLVGRHGFDFRSRPSDDPFYWIPWGHRFNIVLLLLLNALFQFANQVTRILYPTYQEANTWPGVFWCASGAEGHFALQGSGGVICFAKFVWSAHRGGNIRSPMPSSSARLLAGSTFSLVSPF